MPFTRRTIEGLYPEVTFTPASDGTVLGRLTFSREKRNGEFEEITVLFRDLSVGTLACVGSGARIAVWKAKGLVDKRMQQAYDRIITPGQ